MSLAFFPCWENISSAIEEMSKKRAQQKEKRESRRIKEYKKYVQRIDGERRQRDESHRGAGGEESSLREKAGLGKAAWSVNKGETPGTPGQNLRPSFDRGFAAAATNWSKSSYESSSKSGSFTLDLSPVQSSAPSSSNFTSSCSSSGRSSLGGLKRS